VTDAKQRSALQFLLDIKKQFCKKIVVGTLKLEGMTFFFLNASSGVVCERYPVCLAG